MPKVVVPRRWNLVYYNGVATVTDDQLPEILTRDIKLIHDIEMLESITKWEKSDVPEFQSKSAYDNIAQLYVDNDIHLTSINHAVDVINDNRFWVIEKWLKNVSLDHYDPTQFFNTLKQYLIDKRYMLE
jgi:hypothetical protein